MPVNPADGPILGTLYGSDAMRAVFDESAYFQRMLDVEAALARVQGRMGIIPAEAAAAIAAAAKIDNLRHRGPGGECAQCRVSGGRAGRRAVARRRVRPVAGHTGARPRRTSWTPRPSCRCAKGWT